jgi:predicted PurR-regulated permease PerM
MNTRPADNPEAYSTALTGRRWASAALYAALLLVAFWTAREFVPAIAWAAVIAISVWPMLQWLEQRRPFRNRPVLLALVLTSLISIVFVVPLLMLAAQGIAEADSARQWVVGIMRTGIPVPDLIGHLPFGAVQIASWWQHNLAIPLSSSPLASLIAAHGMHGAQAISVTGALGARAAHAVITLGFLLMALFAMLTAGPKLGAQLTAASRRAFGGEGASLLQRMARSARSTVVGLVVVGIGEGVLLGIAYFFAGVPHATLLGMITAFAAMLPLCAPIVFLGAAAWLFVNGSTAAAICVAVTGVVVVFAAEHFVRPALISGSTRLHFLLVLIGILGGAETFGLLGLFIGPALMTILMVLWETWVR